GCDLCCGDAIVTGDRIATGGGDDHFTGSSDADFEVGDSYSPYGRAIGGGDDEINAGPQNDLIIGDSYTKTGLASGAGVDQLHSLQGNDTAYGDNYAADPAGRTSGGAHDFIGGSLGDDHLFGGP